eukprot:TRINITY_DN43184_c0_g1_i1.p2 TRINITY_DN43184_c0_g1~~TRINITY_DN43184_c0_g1_i1.p2  ORF type:complete len:104 (-),score=2.14 TRINITY_DN43184_c0_g1_i1:224-502(-)
MQKKHQKKSNNSNSSTKIRTSMGDVLSLFFAIFFQQLGWYLIFLLFSENLRNSFYATCCYRLKPSSSKILQFFQDIFSALLSGKTRINLFRN